MFGYAKYITANTYHTEDYFLIFNGIHICHITDPDIVQDYIRQLTHCSS